MDPPQQNNQVVSDMESSSESPHPSQQDGVDRGATAAQRNNEEQNNNNHNEAEFAAAQQQAVQVMAGHEYGPPGGLMPHPSCYAPPPQLAPPPLPQNNALVPFGGGAGLPPPLPPPPPPLESHPALKMAHYYEARMRDHATAYASAAAGAAWAAAQIAAAAAEFAASSSGTGASSNNANVNPAGPPAPPPPLPPSWNTNNNAVMPPNMWMYHTSPPAPPSQPYSSVPVPPPPSQSQHGPPPPPPPYGWNHQPQVPPQNQPPPPPPEGSYDPYYPLPPPYGFAAAPAPASSSSPPPPSYSGCGTIAASNHNHNPHPQYHYDNNNCAESGAEQHLYQGYASMNQHNQHNYRNNTNISNNNSSNYNYCPRSSRKKRQEHPQSDESSSIPRRVHIAPKRSPANYNTNHNYSQQHSHQQQLQQHPSPYGGNTTSGGRGNVRRRLRSDGDSSSSGSSFFLQHQNQQQYQQQQQHPPHHYQQQQQLQQPLPHSGAGTITTNNNKRGGSVRQNHHKKPRNTDISLLGKTAVSALYEWCGKRQRTPVLDFLEQVQDEYECVVRMMVVVESQEEEKTTNSSSAAPAAATEIITGSTAADSNCDNNDNTSNNHVLVELGRGRGRTKAAAKQEAARRAVQTLVPGVIFDNTTGILIELPQNHNNNSTFDAAALPQPYPPHTEEEHRDEEQRSSAAAAAAASSSLEDLAPNLAKLLAIGRDEDVVTATTTTTTTAAAEKQDTSILLAAAESKKRVKYHSIKRTMNVYPGTSTTSEEEQDENAYYASRGASVCSALLHAMVQIDPRIREPPEFSFQIVTSLPASSATASNSSSVSSSIQLPRQKVATTATTENLAVFVTRGPFSCTATLRMHEPSLEKEQQLGSEGSVVASVDDNDSDVNDGDDIEEEEDSKPRACQVLTATAVGGTKKESRQMASAQLLALLFPECKTMVEVKAAAEAAREEYAASRALNKQQQIPPAGSVRQRHSAGMTNETRSGIVGFAISQGNDDPPLPPKIKKEIELLVGQKRSSGSGSVGLEEEEVSEFDSLSGSALRQLSRKRQLDAQVEVALQILNERDEEGRSLPDELTDDDVGRTILRRALPEDLSRIKKLLLTETAQCHARPDGRSSEHLKAVPFPASQLWSSSCIVLLLTRAMGAYEDPPLGCAILTLGFSMEVGRILHVTKLASETHLPKERFIECLEDFAEAMKCKLNVVGGQHQDEVISTKDLRMIVSTHLQSKVRRKSTGTYSINNGVDNAIKRISSRLQSVLEESEVSEASSVEKRATKRSSKPSKRSRFA